MKNGQWKRFLLSLFFFLLFDNFSVHGQFKIDSLRQALINKEGNERVDILNALVKDLQRQDQVIGLEMAHEAVGLAVSIKYAEGLILAQLNLSTILGIRNNFQEAIDLAEEALKSAERINFEQGIFKAHFALGGLYLHMGEYELSVNQSIIALDYAEQQEDQKLHADLLNNIGRVQQILGQYQKAEESFISAIEVCENHGLEYNKGVIMVNLALVTYLGGDVETSIDINKKALSIFENFQDQHRIGIALNNIGFGLFVEGDHLRALEYYDKSQSIREKLGDLSGVAKLLLNKAKVYQKMDNLNAAQELVSESMKVAEQSGTVTIIQEVRKFTFKLHQQTGRYKEALNLYQLYSSTKDSLFAIDKQKAIDEMIVKFDNEKLRKENQSALQAGEIKDLKIRQRNYALGIIVILTTVLVLVINRRKLVYQHQVTLNKLHLLRAQFRPHFIFNVLNSVHNSVLKGDTQMASEYLTEFAHLMRQDLKAYDQGEVSLTEELENLKTYLNLEKLRFKERLSFSFTIDSEVNTTDIRVLPMLLQPIAENSIKHGFEPEDQPGHISIKVSKSGHQLLISIEDNGIGLKHVIAASHKSKGLELIRQRLQLQNAKNSFEMKESKESGVIVLIKLHQDK